MSNVAQHQNHHVSGWTGWIVAASVLMFITGAVHILFGLGGVFTQDWYVYSGGNSYLFDSTSWGWSLIVGGILLILTSMLLAAGNMLGRIVAVVLALASLGANIALMPIAPVWSVIAIVFDVCVLYAVIAHGKEMKHLE